MKTKIIKKSGYYKLIIDDKEINKKYGYEDNPIVLGTISEFADAGQWRVEDYRLRKNSLPSPYLEDGVQEYKPKNKDEINYLEKNLHTFKVDNQTGIYYWPRFDSTLYEGGDHPCLTDPKIKQYNSVARFTFQKAYELLKEQKSFWKTCDENDLTSSRVKINNPMRQLSDSEIFFEFSEAKKIMMEAKEKQEVEKKKLKP